MLVNFCNEGLATVRSVQPSSDDHPPTNLISLDLCKRNKGFIVNHFLKPPVVLEVEFSCLINVNKIVVKCSVGLQKSSIIQVIAQHQDSSERTIAWESLNDQEKVLVLQRGRCKVSGRSIFEKYSALQNGYYLSNIKSIKVKILRTAGSTVPSIGGIDVWGWVCSSESKETRNVIHKIWEEINDPKQEEESHTSNDPNSPLLEKQNTVKRSEPNLDVPDDFLDAITCEVLTLPMALPCGKIVDISTIERFNKVEAAYGRVGSDPFTGLPFSERRKPIVATTLKMRLDEYLLRNADKPSLQNIPRTVGRKNALSKVSGTIPLYASSYTPSPSVTGCTPLKDGQKCKDLDSLIESSLAGLPTFLERPEPKKIKYDCFNCSSGSTLFEISCKHLICRNCLILVKERSLDKCICGISIVHSSAIRFHVDLCLR